MAAKFAGSLEATEHMDKIMEMLQDPRLAQWVAATDRNYGTKCRDYIAKAKMYYAEFQLDMEQAG